MTTGVREFDFEADSRTYTCRVERRNELSEPWWWFKVTGDKQRYAPFRASPDDTTYAIQLRITRYYRELLDRRAMPTVPWHRRGRPV
jgi:hypothetical protein